jgi:uncharacterized protein YjgD (DUF1641 family)
MDWAKHAERELQEETNKLLENIEERDMFHTLESSLREMGELQKKNPWAKDTPFIELENEEEMENEEIHDHHETRKE